MAAIDDYYNLGTYSRQITSHSDRARIWFNRGLIWCYGFNHEEATICFERAAAEDDSCAMAYWGIAYALGPNYNKPWDFFDEQELQSIVQRTHRAVEQAEALVGAEESVEHALISALRFRYPKDHADSEKECGIWNEQYAAAMERAYDKYGDDLDVAALYVDSMMNLTPWHLWDLKTGEPAPGAKTLLIDEVLERAFASPGGLDHPGLLHLYIHFVEMGPSPELGLPNADRLRSLVPDAGHLNHMPTHLDIMCGDYRRAIASNAEAIKADEKFVKRAGPINFYTLYRAHNYHFKVYGAMFAGQYQVAIATVAEFEQTLPEQLLRRRSPPMADWLEGFLSMRVHVLVRFGRWKDLLNLVLPSDRHLFCVTTVMIHYGKAIAHAALGNIEAAKKERDEFAAAFKVVPDSRTLFNSTLR